MEIAGKNGKRLSLCVIICIPLFFGYAEAQQSSAAKLPSFTDRDPNLLPHFITKEKEVGSPYLTKTWVTGNVELANHKRIPEADQYVLFNYDKTQSLIYFVNDLNKVWFYPIDSILSFELDDINAIYLFEKIPWISNKFYLSPIIKSAKGYSLYKSLITNFYWADYTTDGYSSKGRKFDEFFDSYVYYLIYPGNHSFRKLSLKKSSVLRELKGESKLLDEFFSLHDDEINEQCLLAIIQYIDDKKYPE
jgi:hypothetical protein